MCSAVCVVLCSLCSVCCAVSCIIRRVGVRLPFIEFFEDPDPCTHPHWLTPLEKLNASTRPDYTEDMHMCVWPGGGGGGGARGVQPLQKGATGAAASAALREVFEMQLFHSHHRLT